MGCSVSVTRSSDKPSGVLAGNRVPSTVPPEEDPPSPPVWEERLHATSQGMVACANDEVAPMAASTIQDEDEVMRWFSEGRTYAWMSEEYERRYNITASASLWADFRRRKGLSRRVVPDTGLVPWHVEEVHRWAFGLAMLRMEARRRAGAALAPGDTVRLAGWRRELAGCGLVVHYDADIEQGFCYVPRRPGLDLDLIREP